VSERDTGRRRSPADSDEAESVEADLDEVIVAWAEILPDLPVATRSSVQQAQPLSVEGDIITFGVPPRLFEAASPRFRREAETIRAALSRRLGRTLRFTLVARDPFDAGASGGAERAPAPPGAPAHVDLDEAEEDIDPADLVDASGPTGADGLSLLTDGLGATVVEERPRE
jgi:hypothetical protein